MLIRTFFWGILIGVLINLLVPVFLSGDKMYTGDDRFSLFLLLMMGLAFVWLLGQQQKRSRQKLRLLTLLEIVTCFSLGTALALGIGHYIQATFIDPDWGNKSLEIAQTQWLAKGYTEEAIAGQIEWTDTFQSPINWAFSLVLFFSIFYTLLGSLIALLFHFRNQAKESFS